MKEEIMSENKMWEPLKVGDIVDVVAPAARASDKELEQGIAYLRDLGLVPRVPKDLQQKDFVFANTDEYRFLHLHESLIAPDSKAVWCLRGGSGSLQLLPRLAEATVPQKAKLFIGLSDITALHLFLNQKWGWKTLHAPVLGRMGTHSPEKEQTELRNVIFGSQKEVLFQLQAFNDAAKVSETFSAPIVGGNLTVVHATLGSSSAINGQERILFFEDVGERGYRIDRTLESMKQAGVFYKAKAVVFGDFVGGNEADGRNFVKDALRRFANSLTIPVLAGVQSGHGSLQRPVPLNVLSTLKTGSSATLSCTFS